MFDIFSWQHIIIMLVVALVVVGPKDLPRLMNMVGKWAGKARAMAGEFRRSFDEMARESELAELRKEIDNLKKNNPISDLASSVADVEAEVRSSIEAVAPAQMAETAAAEIVEPRSGEFADTAPRPRNAPIVESP